MARCYVPTPPIRSAMPAHKPAGSKPVVDRLSVATCRRIGGVLMLISAGITAGLILGLFFLAGAFQ